MLHSQVKFAVNTETGDKVAIKILDKDKIQKQNMGSQIKKEVRNTTSTLHIVPLAAFCATVVAVLQAREGAPDARASSRMRAS